MRIAIARTMPNFSMDVYADGLVEGLRAVRPNWEIIELAPHPIDRRSRSLVLRIRKFYERFWRFPHSVQQQTADVFHIIDHSEAHIAYGLKKQGKPVVVTCHDLINFFYRDNLKGSVQLPFVSSNSWLHSVKGMQQADYVVAVSSVTAKDTAQILNIDPARIIVAPDAVEAVFQPASKEQVEAVRQTYQVSPETFCLLNVGSDHPRKNILTILKALVILKQQGLPVKFWRAGSDFTDEEKVLIQTQGLENYVAYLGKPDKPTLVQIYSAADVLVAPSFHEGFGMTLLESMACGTPTITSNCSAMPEVVGDSGILIDPKDEKAVAEAVTHLYKNTDLYQRLVQQGLTRSHSFTWENTAEQIAQIYEKLIGQRTPQTVAQT